MIWNEILCLGDSLTAGARDRYRRGYPMELSRILTEETGEFYFCHDYGVCGDTSSDLLRRVWNIAKGNQNARIAIIMIGTNDTQIDIPEDIYEDNLRQIISVLKLYGMKIIVSKLPTLGFTPLYLNNTSNIAKYNNVIDKLCIKMDCVTCDLLETEKFYIDGVHYTHEGYNLLAAIFSKTIMKLQKSG
jgi:lysophospholipase L1-like esterase